MPKVAIAIIAALEREVSGLTKHWTRVEREYQGRNFLFLRREEHERDEMIVVCGGIGMEAARRAAEAVIALYRPTLLQSVGFAGALETSLRVGDVFAPAVVIDARDGSRTKVEGRIEGGNDRGGNNQGTLVTFMEVAGKDQKASLARAYGAQAVDMEAAAVAAAARAHGIRFGVTKVISDEMNFEMPQMARFQMARFIDPHGRFRTARFAFFAAARPWLWPRVAQLAANSRKAATALGKHLQSLRPSSVHPEAQAAAASELHSGGHAGGHK